MTVTTATTPWIFGYGSLIWRPGFSFSERRVGRVHGWMRRFWQASTDHRGVPGAPGRVATLVPAPEQTCLGIAYRLDPATSEDVLGHLDWREKGGYARHQIRVTCEGAADLTALIYIGTADNPAFRGPEETAKTADIVRYSRGPSGTNVDYLLELAAALEGLGEHEPYLRELVAAVQAVPAQAPPVPRAVR